ncbi:MAG: GNAT family N-acetyltransferase [Propionibacteriaceae bacterium]|nr:GNAT family N-acetyltransferase [Propionibacteriaceae bacterium]
MIRGDLTNLRAIDRGDDNLLFAWLNDPAVMAGWGVPDQTLSRTEIQRRMERYLEEERSLGRPAALIIETLDGEPVGLVILSQYATPAASTEVSILIGDPSRWGQGLGSDALGAVLDACFDAWNLHRVWLRAEADNTRAGRLYARLGFTHEGTLRDATYRDGEYVDVLVYGLLRGNLNPADADIHLPGTYH